MNLMISRNSHEGQYGLFPPEIEILDGCLRFFTIFERHLFKKFLRFESRQVFDLEIKIHVTEYRAEVLVHEKNEKFVVESPKGVTQLNQYVNQVKATSVYMSYSTHSVSEGS
jgi:hypothetical protein